MKLNSTKSMLVINNYYYCVILRKQGDQSRLFKYAAADFKFAGVKIIIYPSMYQKDTDMLLMLS